MPSCNIHKFRRPSYRLVSVCIPRNNNQHGQGLDKSSGAPRLRGQRCRPGGPVQIPVLGLREEARKLFDPQSTSGSTVSQSESVVKHLRRLTTAILLSTYFAQSTVGNWFDNLHLYARNIRTAGARTNSPAQASNCLLLAIATPVAVPSCDTETSSQDN